jgi:hypothetical protein
VNDSLDNSVDQSQIVQGNAREKCKTSWTTSKYG